MPAAARESPVAATLSAEAEAKLEIKSLFECLKADHLRCREGWSQRAGPHTSERDRGDAGPCSGGCFGCPSRNLPSLLVFARVCVRLSSAHDLQAGTHPASLDGRLRAWQQVNEGHLSSADISRRQAQQARFSLSPPSASTGARKGSNCQCP
eukprot:5254406-Pleurochrysis_carterae.AAC.1